MNSNDGRNRSRRKCCGKYLEEKFESKRFASLLDEDFQKRDKREKPQTRPGPQTLQFARLEHFKGRRNNSGFESLSSE